jgi:F-type H+-transporting ATPase subunit delta
MRTARDNRRDATRLWRLCLVHRRPDPVRVRAVVEGLVDTTRVGAPGVLSHFLRLVRLDQARRSAHIESATPLDLGECEALNAMLVRRYGDDMTTTFEVNPALIGGVRIAAGSEVYDTSIRARLAAVEASFGSRIPDPEVSRCPR